MKIDISDEKGTLKTTKKNTNDRDCISIPNTHQSNTKGPLLHPPYQFHNEVDDM